MRSLNAILSEPIASNSSANSPESRPPCEKWYILSRSSFRLNGMTDLVDLVVTLLEQVLSSFLQGVCSSASLIRHVSIERTIPLIEKQCYLK